MKTIEKARFDTKLSKEQKDFFEYAASIGGFRTLTEFVITSVQEKAKKIVEEHSKIISTRKEQKIFFDEIINPSKPNNALKNAAIRYKKLMNSL